jgi:hypothetical protein
MAMNSLSFLVIFDPTSWARWRRCSGRMIGLAENANQIEKLSR